MVGTPRLTIMFANLKQLAEKVASIDLTNNKKQRQEAAAKIYNPAATSSLFDEDDDILTKNYNNLQPLYMKRTSKEEKSGPEEVQSQPREPVAQMPVAPRANNPEPTIPGLFGALMKKVSATLTDPTPFNQQSRQAHGAWQHQTQQQQEIVVVERPKEAYELPLYEYMFIDTPRYLFETHLLDEILSRDDLDDSYNEQLRQVLEHASKHPQRWEVAPIDRNKLHNYLDTCAEMEIVLSTIQTSEKMHAVFESVEDEWKRDLSVFLINMDATHLMPLVFAEFVANTGLKYTNRLRLSRRTLSHTASDEEDESDDDSMTTPEIELNKERQDAGANEADGEYGGFAISGICNPVGEWVRGKKYEHFREKIGAAIDGMVGNSSRIDKTIGKMIHKNGDNFWASCDELHQTAEDTEKLEQATCSMRSHLSKIKSECFEAKERVHKIQQKKRKVEEALNLVQALKTRYEKIIRFCKLNIIDADQDELPEVYEALMISLVHLDKPVPQEMAKILLPQTVRRTVLEQLEIIKRRIKGELYTHIGLYNHLVDTQPPPRELVDVFMLYNEISSKYKELVSDHPQELCKFAEDSILLKTHCMQLLNMDDSLTCIQSNIITDFF